MSYDVGLQPTAQKYFVLALHAAKEAGDRPLGSYVLSSMSRQMIHLGRPDDALELIHLAQYGSRDCASATHPGDAVRDGGPRLRQHGPAQQVQPGGADGRGHLRRRRRRDEPTPTGSASSPRPSCTRENAHSYRDLAYVAGRSPTYASLAQPGDGARPSSCSARTASHQRSYALNLVGMASVHLLQREPEQAAHVAEPGHRASPSKVRSERVNTRIRRTAAHRRPRLRRRPRGRRARRPARRRAAGGRRGRLTAAARHGR